MYIITVFVSWMASFPEESQDPSPAFLAWARVNSLGLEVHSSRPGTIFYKTISQVTSHYFFRAPEMA